MSKSFPKMARCRVVVSWIDWYPYHFARFAGLQSVFGNNGEARGIEFVGGAGVHQGYVFRAAPAPRPEIETLMPDASWSEVSQWALAWKLWRTLSKLNPQVILVPGYYNLPGIVTALWAKWHARRSILMTESAEVDHARTPWKESVKRFLLKAFFDAAICGGMAHKRYLENLGFEGRPIGSFYDVVGNDDIATAVDELRENGSSVAHDLPRDYLLFVGRLAEEKNVTGLLEAWLLYRELGGNMPLVLAGDGPERSALEQRAQMSGVTSGLHFLGHRSAEELVSCFAFAKALVLPSTREPWGLVVNEAMASGLPVIVSDRCGCAEDLVRSGINGMVFDPYKTEVLLECLCALDNRDRPTLKRMGQASRSMIAAYSPQAFGEAVQALAESRVVFAAPSQTSSDVSI